MENNVTKEVDQRHGEEIIFRCSCGSDDFIVFSFSSDDFFADYSISLIEGQGHRISFMDKLRDCWRYMRKTHHELCYCDMILTAEDLKKVVRHANKYIEIVSKK